MKITMQNKKIEQTIYAIAAGDSLGMPTEDMTPTTISRKFGQVDQLIDTYRDGSDGSQKKMLAGEVTDDTENTVFICEALYKCSGDITPEFLVKQMNDWLSFGSNSKYVVGPSTLNALKKINAGTPIEQAGIHGATNGCAMKIAPVGVVTDYKDIKGLVDRVEQVCMPTHNTSVGIAGASIIAAAVSFSFRNKLDNDAAIASFFSVLHQTYTEAVKRGNDVPTTNMWLKIEMAINAAQKIKTDGDYWQYLYDVVGTGLPIVETVPAVVGIAMRLKFNTWDCIVAAANIGGDTDTLGAIVGAICAPQNFNLSESVVKKINESNPDIDFRLAIEQLNAVLVGEKI